MKTRWFLRGLGIGIIISALFLCIGYREQSDHNELIKEAKKIGMVFPKEETTSVELAENLNNIQKQEVVSEAAVTTTAETEQEKNSRQKPPPFRGGGEKNCNQSVPVTVRTAFEGVTVTAPVVES